MSAGISVYVYVCMCVCVLGKVYISIHIYIRVYIYILCIYIYHGAKLNTRAAVAFLDIDDAVVLFHLHEMRLFELLLHLREHVLHASNLLILLQQQAIRFRNGRIESVC